MRLLSRVPCYCMRKNRTKHPVDHATLQAPEGWCERHTRIITGELRDTEGSCTATLTALSAEHCPTACQNIHRVATAREEIPEGSEGRGGRDWQCTLSSTARGCMVGGPRGHGRCTRASSTFAAPQRKHSRVLDFRGASKKALAHP